MTRIVYTEQASAIEDPITIRIYEPVRYAEGGLHTHAEAVRQAGRFGDDVLLHVTPDEFQQLQQAWGDPTRNPVTGLPEYGFLSKVFKGIGKIAKLDPVIGSKSVQHFGSKVGKGLGKVLQNPIVQKLGPIAANFFLPGVGGLIASAALGAVNAKLSGGSGSDLLKGAVKGGLGHFISGGGLGVGDAATHPLSSMLGGGGGGGSGPLSKIFGGGSRADFAAPGGVGGALTPEDYVSGAGVGSGGGGPLSKLTGLFKNSQGNPAWGKIAGAGLGALALMKGVNDQPSGHLGPQVQPNPADLKHLQPTPLNRQVVGLPSNQDYYTYGQSGGEHNFFQPMRAGGHYIKGPGTGRSDQIDAKLSNDEYVMDAETVSLLGDGSPEEGARRLDQLRTNLRKHKGQQLSKGKFSSNAKPPEDYLPKEAKGGLFHPGEGSMEALRSRRQAKGMISPTATADVPLQNKRRLIDMLENKKPDYSNMSDADLADVSKWLDAIRNTPPPQKAKGGRIPPIGPELRAVTGGMPKSDEMRAASLAAVQRFRDALKAQAAQQAPPVAKPAPTQQQELLKFSKGGAIAAMNKFADDLEEQLESGNTERIKQLKSQMDTLHTGLGSLFDAHMLTGTE